MARTARRKVDGILILDKPIGITSNDALQRVKYLFNAKKVGHTGSLDKPASGLLALCFGEATKISTFLLSADKSYQVTCRLGTTTTTGDADGKPLLKKAVPALSTEDIEATLQQFLGTTQQIPPMYSALKHQGRPLYKLAYAGQEVKRTARPITIHQLDLITQRQDGFTLRVHCSKGTYIRTLIEDIGQALDCGAHVSSLRRLSVGIFQEQQMITLNDLQNLAEQGTAALDQQLLAIDSPLSHIPAIELSADSAQRLLHGQSIELAQTYTTDIVRIYGQEQQFIGIGKIKNSTELWPRRLIAQNPQ